MKDGNVVSRSIGMEKRELVTKERERRGRTCIACKVTLIIVIGGSSV